MSLYNMSISEEQASSAILKTFYSMQEGQEYVLNDKSLQEVNNTLKEFKYSKIINNKNEHKFVRKGDCLLMNGDNVFNFKKHKNPALIMFLASPFASAVAGALVNNELEKLQKIDAKNIN